MDPEDVTDDLVIDDLDENQEDIGEEEITFGDEPESKPIAEIRNAYKDKAREAAELKRRVSELEEKVKPVVTDVGPRPKEEDFDYDSDAYNKAVDDWHEARFKAQLQKEEVAKPDQELQQKFQQKVENFKSSVATLEFADAQDCVDGALKILSLPQQAAIVKAVKDPAKFVYALGRNPEKLSQLADHTDLAEFIADVVRLETNMTTRKRPAADTPVSGNASTAITPDSKAEAKLEKEARETGDYTKLFEYRRAKAA